MDKKINWGIAVDLQADVRYEPNACKGYVLDVSLGCPHHCIYCLFSPLEIRVYKLQNPKYKGDILPLRLDKFRERKEFPPAVYMCYSSDPLGNGELVQSTVKILNKLLDNNVNVFFISKGVFTDDVLQVIKKKPELMHVQVDAANTDEERNRIIEPGAPSYSQRLENIKKLSGIEGLGGLSIRIDPMLPEIDDTEENIARLIDDVSKLGVKEAVMGYVVLTKAMRESWKRNEYTKSCAEALCEKTPTISEQELFSIPFDLKTKKLAVFEEICRARGVKMSCCGCKDERYKATSFEWICHPFNRKRREELAASAGPGFHMEVEHLK